MLQDTIRMNARHIQRVGELLAEVIGDLALRAARHDASKWSEAEWPRISEYTPAMAGVKFDSPEYHAIRDKMKPALDHHYSSNRHHPEFHAGGIAAMTLVDLIEMMCDWKAASERHPDGTIANSLRIGEGRFDISPQLLSILRNTAAEAGWLSPQETK